MLTGWTSRKNCSQISLGKREPIMVNSHIASTHYINSLFMDPLSKFWDD